MIRKKQSGFTLIELLAVVVVLAIILAIAVPAISNVITSSRKSAFESDAKMVLQAVKYKNLRMKILMK
jgi:type IV pilus assembly protein PilA